MTIQIDQIRQSVSANSNACDTRFGSEVLDRFGKDLRIVVGKPRKALLVARAAEDPDLVEAVRRQLTDAGFVPEVWAIGDNEDLTTCAWLPVFWGELAARGLTPDDGVAVVGTWDLVGAVEIAAAGYGAGIRVGAVVTSWSALVTCPATPARLSAGDLKRMVGARNKLALCYATPESVGDAEADVLLARAFMVQSAVCESQEAFKTLVGRSEAIASGDIVTQATQALDSARGRGRVASSTSPAVRASLAYGETMAFVLEKEAGIEPAFALSEGMRFAARLAVGLEMGDVDFVYTQDGLLDRLGLVETGFDIPADVMVERMKAETFARSNRFMPQVPYAPGRVRATACDDEVLAEFAGAFCAARRRLVTK